MLYLSLSDNRQQEFAIYLGQLKNSKSSNTNPCAKKGPKLKSPNFAIKSIV